MCNKIFPNLPIDYTCYFKFKLIHHNKTKVHYYVPYKQSHFDLLFNINYLLSILKIRDKISVSL